MRSPDLIWGAGCFVRPGAGKLEQESRHDEREGLVRCFAALRAWGYRLEAECESSDLGLFDSVLVWTCLVGEWKGKDRGIEDLLVCLRELGRQVRAD